MNMQIYKYLIIILLIAILVAAFFVINGAVNKSTEMNLTDQNKSNEINLVNVLQKINISETYTMLKEEKLGNLTRDIIVMKDHDNVYVMLNDSNDLYVVEYLRKDGKEQLCFTFVEKGCGNISQLSLYQYLPNEEQGAFIKSSIVWFKTLIENNALHVESIEKKEQCLNITYNYSYAELSLNALKSLGLDSLPVKELKAVYRESLCIKDNMIYSFSRYKDNEFIGSWHVKHYEENADIKELKPEGNTIRSYNTWKLYMEKINENDVKDPQIRSIATEFGKPEICLKAEDKDTCLYIYAQKLMRNESCYLITNETKKEQCFNYVKNLSS